MPHSHRTMNVQEPHPPERRVASTAAVTPAKLTDSSRSGVARGGARNARTLGVSGWSCPTIEIRIPLVQPVTSLLAS